MNRIAVLHANNTYNYGSLMMLVNFLFYTEQQMCQNNIEFLIQCDSQEDFKRIQGSCRCRSRIRALYVRAKEDTHTPMAAVRSAYNKFVYSTYKILAYKPASVVVLGGDDLSEYYSKSVLALELCRLALFARSMRVIVLGQTIGPFSSWRTALARTVLRRCHVFLRDPVSYGYAKEVLQIPHSELYTDLALLDLPGQEIDAEAYRDFALKEQEYVTIVPSGLVSHYARNADVYVQSWAVVLQRMVAMPAFQYKKIVLLAHVLKPNACDDRLVIQDVHKAFIRMCPEHRDRCVLITQELLPTRARSILGNGCLTITGRMHAAVSSIQMGVPAVCLSYGVKYQGVIGESLGMRNWVIEAGDGALWENGRIVDILMEKIEDIISDAVVRVRISDTVNASKKRAHSQMRRTAELLQEP